MPVDVVHHLSVPVIADKVEVGLPGSCTHSSADAGKYQRHMSGELGRQVGHACVVSLGDQESVPAPNGKNVCAG